MTATPKPTPMASGALVLMRHGESVYNLENRFAGWTDVPLSEAGRKQSIAAAEIIKSWDGGRSTFARVYTSVLSRSVESTETVLAALGHAGAAVVRSYRLNERHYGILEGRNKIEASMEFGEARVHLWRRSYDVAPPPLPRSDSRHPAHDPRYAGLPPQELPSTECLRDAVRRLVPLWQTDIAPSVFDDGPVLVCAHGSTARAIIALLEGLTTAEILTLNVPNGYPMVLELESVAGAGAPDESSNPRRSSGEAAVSAEAGSLSDGRLIRLVRRYYLGNPEHAERAARRVARQAVPPEHRQT